MSAQEKRHWYLLSFVVPVAGAVAHVSMFMSSTVPNLTLPILQAARSKQNIPVNACLTGTSYMGYMTQDEFAPPETFLPPPEV